MALAPGRQQREKDKFVADANGDATVRVVITGGVQLASGTTFDIKDSNGNVVLSIDENGDIFTDGVISPLP